MDLYSAFLYSMLKALNTNNIFIQIKNAEEHTFTHKLFSSYKFYDFMYFSHLLLHMCCSQAAKLAVERGWALNVGGGFHHCSADKGGGFCAYADITLALRFLFDRVEGIAKAMIVDLDAHQVGWIVF